MKDLLGKTIFIDGAMGTMLAAPHTCPRFEYRKSKKNK